MSDDKNNKSGGWVSNPLPIVMVVLLAAGVLVKNVPLESARPTDPERVKSVPTSQQDVEARLWQDPFAAVEKHEEGSKQDLTPKANVPMMPFTRYIFTTPPAPHTPEVLSKRIQELHEIKHDVTIVAVSVFGGSFNEAAESRRRSRFAVVSALGFHEYHPVLSEALGYFHIDLPKPKSESKSESKSELEPETINLTVPYEWFETRDKSSNVLVLWLNEDKFSNKPLTKLNDLITELTPTNPGGKGLTVKLVGPAGSATLKELVSDIKESGRSAFQVFAPGATISSCDLHASWASADKPSWDCFMNSPDPQSDPLKSSPIIRTTGTDDVLSAALLWELWQRGINREPWTPAMGPNNTSYPPPICEDGLVLIGERDTEYGRTLVRYLNDGFSERCKAKPDGNLNTSHTDNPLAHEPPVRMFTYLRGLDGVLPDIDKSGGNTPRKDDGGQSKDLRAQLKDAPPEHAEGRNQFDYLRRFADEVDRLDHDKKSFAKNGVKAIGIVGSDLYDKLLILQALRSRFKDKIFFTTDLDARYLHADQKDWARNLVVASNFGLSLRPALQQSTLPFRDSYQTATYLATLMALDNKSADHWASKMEKWLRPQLFEIGRTEAVHLASPSVERLKKWFDKSHLKDIADETKDTKCNPKEWAQCENIEPDWPSRGISLEHLPAILIILCLGILLVALTGRYVHETVRAAFDSPSPNRDAARATISHVLGLFVVVSMILAVVWILMDKSIADGVNEPFVWLEGVSVWPSLVLRFVGLVTMLALWYMFLKRILQHNKLISKDFEIALPNIRTLTRSWWSAAFTGPHFDLASFDKKGKADTKSALKKESTEEKSEVSTLWQNYLRATRWREMAGWIAVSMLIGFVLSFVLFKIFGWPSFPHRGQLVETLHRILVFSNALVLWLIIFWVGYETRACVRFIEALSGMPNEWPDQLLARKAEETGVPRAHLDDYLDFQLIVQATQRIHWLIYLPFVSILFMVLSRSDFFDTMDFPLALVFVVGLALTYALHSARLLYSSAEAVRTTALANYEKLRSASTWPPISAEQINLLMERIRSTREGAFAPPAQQPALQALLLPFGSYGGIQLVEFLFKL